MDEAANEIAFNTRKLHKCLEIEKLYLAPDKSKILTTNKELAKKIEERLMDLGYTHEVEVKLLGVDWASGESVFVVCCTSLSSGECLSDDPGHVLPEVVLGGDESDLVNIS